ncbi:Peroxiredoxin-6 [Gracilariopsis chorda]|uniref:Peroxiredoxin-6 n=1 Tax=Gracilariopsis chorda TaxID=448386 RepID=A0A2V3ILF0_9FLOR|nr:Peroxiredoxin-6 [Gracilariopsis chorda]|eukprot:PXF42906.1 Peroxiredoxin-6 [Gracilariopsis chorda]
MAPLIGETAPNFTADSTEGEITLHDYIKHSWAILFSHPADFTPVCTTELARVSQLLPEFQKRNVKCLALSCDSSASHNAWIPDICSFGGKSESTALGYPIIADEHRTIARTYGMLPASESSGMAMTVRSVFVIGPDAKVKLSLTYPASTGRNFDEIVRVIDSLQLAVSSKVATPVDWKKGDECVVLPSVSDEQAEQLFPKGFNAMNLPSGKAYLRMTPMPDAE